MQATIVWRGAWTMPQHGLTPSEWDLVKAISGAFTGLGGVFVGLWAWGGRQRRRALRRRAEAEMKVADEVAAHLQQRTAEVVASIQEVAATGRRQATDDLVNIRDTTDLLREWTDEHTSDDQKQFAALALGQKRTEQALDEISITLRRLDGEIRTIRDVARDAAHDVAEILKRGGS